MKYLALLREINISEKNKISMIDLKNYRKSNWWNKTASTDIKDSITIRTANIMKNVLEICKK